MPQSQFSILRVNCLGTLISEVVINVAFRGNTSVLRGKTVAIMDFIGFLEMVDAETKISVHYVFISVKAFLDTDISESAGLTRRVEAAESIFFGGNSDICHSFGLRGGSQRMHWYRYALYVTEGLKEVFIGIWEAARGENTLLMGRAAETLPFTNGDVCLGTVTGISTEDKNGFGEKLAKELAFNDIREVLDKSLAVSKYETVIN